MPTTADITANEADPTLGIHQQTPVVVAVIGCYGPVTVASATPVIILDVQIMILLTLLQ
jgi:hypothetical protein